MSRYGNVTEDVIDACQRDDQAGRRPNSTVSHLDLSTARIIVAESLEADALLKLRPEQVVAQVDQPRSDWALAVTAELLFGLAEIGRKRPDATPEGPVMLERLAYQTLERTLDSPTAGPLVWYDGVFDDVARAYWRAGNPHGVDLIVRQLAYVLRFEDGENAAITLRDLAEAFMHTGQTERGLALLAALLRNDPTDVWVYNTLTFVGEDLGLPRLGAEAGRRGLALLNARGDRENVREQITEQVQALEAGTIADREGEVDPAALADVQSALQAEFAPGPRQPWAELVHQHVPEVAHARVKRPATPPDLPRPGAARAVRPKPGRNDPCWCGSGKKYKHCHLTADRAVSR